MKNRPCISPESDNSNLVSAGYTEPERFVIHPRHLGEGIFGEIQTKGGYWKVYITQPDRLVLEAELPERFATSTEAINWLKRNSYYDF